MLLKRCRRRPRRWRSCVPESSALSAFDPDAADNSQDATARRLLRLTAQMPTLVAAWERIRKGKAPVAPNPKLRLAANFLYMLTGKKATPLAAKTSTSP